MATATKRKSKGEIMTYTGRRVKPLRLRAEDVCIEDIARALSNLCRYCGHVRYFYSVAQHSVLVSRYCDPEDALYGLLHDGAEAYLADLPAPIKHSPALAEYRKVEARVEKVIFRAFGLKPTTPASIKETDVCLREAEVAVLKNPANSIWAGWVGDGERTIPPTAIQPMGPEAAYDYFMDRWSDLA